MAASARANIFGAAANIGAGAEGLAMAAGGAAAGIAAKIPMGYHLVKPKRSKWDLAYDAWDSFTTYHREPKDVKIKVGPIIGLINFTIWGAVLGWTVFRVARENVYMLETLPVGLYTHWAEGDGAMITAGTTQMESASHCGYNQSVDYLYGLDNIWDYSAMACTLGDVGQVAFKDGNAMHIITHEQRRRSDLIPMVGSSCDDECRTVYPEWPSAASYGSKSWKAVFVNSSLYQEAKRTRPSLAQVPNVRMRKPEIVGGNCRCQSFENVYFAGAEKIEIVITHKYKTKFMTGDSRSTGETDPISFVMVESTGKVVKVIEKGKSVIVSPEEMLEALGTCMDCQPSEPYYMNSLCPDGVCPGSYQPKPPQRSAGLTIDVRTEYYTHKVTVPRQAGYEEIMLNYEPPYAIHLISKTEDWTSRGSSLTIQQLSDRVVKHDTYRYGTLVKIGAAGGKISRFDPGTIIRNLIDLTVMAQYPGLLCSIIVFTCLGHKSKLIRAAQRSIVTIPELYRSFTYNAILAETTWRKIDSDNNAFISHEEFKNMLSTFFLDQLYVSVPGQPQEWYENKMNIYVDMMLNIYQMGDEEVNVADASGMTKQERASITGISKQDFIDSVLKSEPIVWEDMVMKLRDDTVDHGPIDKLCNMMRRLRKRSSAAKVTPKKADETPH